MVAKMGRWRRDDQRLSRWGFHGRVHELVRAQAKRSRGAFWTGLAALLVRRSVFRSLGRTIAVGAGVGFVAWAGGWMGILDAPPPPLRKGRRIARAGAALVGQVAYGIVSVLPLYASTLLARRHGPVTGAVRR